MITTKIGSRDPQSFSPGYASPASDSPGTEEMVLSSGKAPIVMACDEAYAMPLATTLRSLAETSRASGRLDVIVLTSQFSPTMRHRVATSLPRDSVALHWVTVDIEAFQAFSTRPYISKVTYARLLVSQFIPRNISRVLYLDADILVTDSVAPLCEIDLQGAAVGAVLDTDAQNHSQRLELETSQSRDSHSHGVVSLQGRYFNAGVLLIDLPRWREYEISEKAMQYIARHPHTLLADQDALNIACAGSWKELGARWNWQTHDPRGFSRMAADQRPTIVHFAGRWKPWNPASLSPDAHLYDGFRSRTTFARTRREKAQDSIRYSWARMRDSLRQYKALHALYRRLTSSRSADIA